MRIGSKSVLFGVHQFIWHPISVALAWRRYYGSWPNLLWQWVAIFCHDLGYWGLPNMDGAEGQEHPTRSAEIVGRLTWLLDDREIKLAQALILGHSKYYCKKHRYLLSALYAPDKLCVLHDPQWFYLLRGSLSGEIAEFVQNAPPEASITSFDLGRDFVGYTFQRRYWMQAKSKPTRYWFWLRWYRGYIRAKFLCSTEN